jgi:hypothetical protein
MRSRHSVGALTWLPSVVLSLFLRGFSMSNLQNALPKPMFGDQIGSQRNLEDCPNWEELIRLGLCYRSAYEDNDACNHKNSEC